MNIIDARSCDQTQKVTLKRSEVREQIEEERARRKRRKRSKEQDTVPEDLLPKAYFCI